MLCDFDFSGSSKKKRLIRILIICLGVLLLLLIIALALYISLRGGLPPLQRAEQILSEAPLIDGYNGFALSVRILAKNDLSHFNLSRNLTDVNQWSQAVTDIPRLRAGKVGAQIWSAGAECMTQHKDAVVVTLEQIDVIKRMIDSYGDDLELVVDAEGICKGILKAVKAGKIASIISVDGGHSIQYSLAVLRTFYSLGVRKLALTTECGTPWAQSYTVEIKNRTKHDTEHGLSVFGEAVIREMNRLGMIIDISHSSVATMRDVLTFSKAPVIFSRSAAKSVCERDENVPDEILRLVVKKDAQIPRKMEGVLMINFFPDYVKCNANGRATIGDLIRQLEYIRSRASVDNIGIGSSFGDIDSYVEGLEDVSKFPNLFAKLIETGNWTDDDLEKLAGKNFLRVFNAVEQIREDMKEVSPYQTWIKKSDLRKHTNLSCSGTSLGPDLGHHFNF